MSKTALLQFIGSNLPAPPELLGEIADQFEERMIPKNVYFLEAGRISNEYLFLEEGCMRAFTLDTEGDEVTTGFFVQNRVVMEPASFFLRIPSEENIQTLTDCRVHLITFEKLNHLFHSIPQFREFGRALLVKEFAIFKQRTLGLINQTAEERYDRLISTNKEIFQHAQMKQIASYLGITDTSLSRIRREYPKK